MNDVLGKRGRNRSRTVVPSNNCEKKSVRGVAHNNAEVYFWRLFLPLKLKNGLILLIVDPSNEKKYPLDDIVYINLEDEIDIEKQQAKMKMRKEAKKKNPPTPKKKDGQVPLDRDHSSKSELGVTVTMSKSS